MVTREDLESFLLRSEQEFDEVEPGMWTVQSGTGARVVVHYSPPLLILRAKVLDVPEGESRCVCQTNLYSWDSEC